MARVHIITIKELGDDGRWTTVADASYESPHIPMRADRGAVGQAKAQGQQAQSTSGNLQSNANTERSALIPGLIRDANNPMGLTPTQRNQQMVSGQEALGGTNAGLTGAAKLASARTRNAGGFSAALDEAARQKSRAQAGVTQGVNNLDTQLALQKQQQARNALQGLYGVDTSGMLKGMGIENEDLNTQLAAGRQGWLQDVESGLNTVGNLGANAAGVKKAFG